MIFSTLVWLLTLEILAWAILPVVRLALIKEGLDRALALARVVGLLVIGYLCWLLTYIGLLPLHPISTFLVILLVAGGNWLYLGSRLDLYRHLAQSKRALLSVTAVYLAAFLVFLSFRALSPEIFWGEKPMDFTLLSYFVRLEQLPAQDPWAAGSRMHYYYLGSFLYGLILKFTPVAPSVGYNLALASVAAQMASATYAVGLLLVKRKPQAVWGGAFFLLISNTEGVRLLLEGKALNFDLYWATSRVLRHAMANEYPIWSLLFADLHAHLIAWPLTAALLALGVGLLRSPISGPSRLTCLMAYGFLWGALGPTNSWDFLSFGLFTLVFFMGQCKRFPTRRSIADALCVGVTALATLAPFFSTLRTGRELHYGWELYGFNSLSQILRHLSHFLFPLALGLIPIALSTLRRRRRWGLALLGAALPFALGVWSKAAAPKPWGILALSSLLALLGAAAAQSRPRRWQMAGLFSWAAGWLIALSELFWLVDHMNTLFKVYCAVWTLLSFALIGVLPELRLVVRSAWKTFTHKEQWFLRAPHSKLPPVPRLGPWLALGGLAVCSLAAVVGSLLHIYVMTTFHRVPGPRPTLDGAAYLTVTQPDEKKLIDWLNRNVRGIPTVLEAHGHSYGAFTRISMHTGLPTLLGWDHHVKQRGLSPHELELRKRWISEFYSTADPHYARRLLAQYPISYVVVGTLERLTYPPTGLLKFERDTALFQKVFESNQQQVFQVLPF